MSPPLCGGEPEEVRGSGELRDVFGVLGGLQG